MRAVIIGNGVIEDYDYIAGKIRKGDYIMCADGGYMHAKKLGVRPDVLIGDMDSLADNDFDGETINLPIRKDFTDTEVCVKYALLKAFEEIVMLGCTGCRIDHSMTNIFLLKQISEAGIKGKIIDEHNEIIYAENENTIYGKKGDIISIIPIGGDLSGITTDGLSYPLSDEELLYGESKGVSNIMLSNKCSVSIKSGTGIIIRSKD